MPERLSYLKTLKQKPDLAETNRSQCTNKENFLVVEDAVQAGIQHVSNQEKEEQVIGCLRLSSLMKVIGWANSQINNILIVLLKHQFSFQPVLN